MSCWLECESAPASTLVQERAIPRGGDTLWLKYLRQDRNVMAPRMWVTVTHDWTDYCVQTVEQPPPLSCDGRLYCAEVKRLTSQGAVILYPPPPPPALSDIAVRRTKAVSAEPPEPTADGLVNLQMQRDRSLSETDRMKDPLTSKCLSALDWIYLPSKHSWFHLITKVCLFDKAGGEKCFVL